MPLLRPRRNRPDLKAQAKREAMRDAVTALAKAVGGAGAGPVMPGAQFQGGWNNLGNASMAMVQRVTANMAQQMNIPLAEIEAELVEQGLSWGPPFPPGRPLDPFFGFRRPPRTWDFSVGENVQITPRWNRISFATLKAIYEAYDVAQVCVRRLVNDVRSLDFAWVPVKGLRDDVSEDIAQARAFFEFPDRRQPFRNWLAEYLQDVLRYDAGALYIRRSEDNTPIALEVVSGEGIIPLVDFYGRVAADEDDNDPPPLGETWEGGETPAFLQIIEGLPWVWLTTDDLIYQPWNPMPDSQYGLAPLEAVLLSANTDLRFQKFFLDYFTAGSVPQGFMEAPEDMSDPTQIAEWQETWDALMLGDQEKLRQIRWVPAGAKYTPTKPGDFKEEFPLYLMRRTCAAYGVTPNDLGFVSDVNRANGETQVDIQWRVGTLPLLRHIEDVVNLFVAKHLGLRCRLQFDKGQEVEDRIATAQAHKIYVEMGAESVDEVRGELGWAVDRERPMPRYIANARVGVIPLIAVASMSGKIDEETYAPDKDQPLVPNPYMPVPGVVPQMGTPEFKATMQASAETGNHILEQSSGGKPSPEMQQLIDEATPPPPGQNPATTAQPASVPPAQGDGSRPEPDPDDEQTASKSDAQDKLAHLLRAAMPGYGDLWVNDAKRKVLIAMGDGDDNDHVQAVMTAAREAYPGYDVDQEAESRPSAGNDWRWVYHGGTAPSADLLARTGYAKEATAGITAGTGIQGNPLAAADDDDDDEHDDAVTKALTMELELRRWRANSRQRLRKGKPPRRFHSEVLGHDTVELIYGRLQHARSRGEVDALFDAALGKAEARSAGYRPRSRITPPR